MLYCELFIELFEYISFFIFLVIFKSADYFNRFLICYNTKISILHSPLILNKTYLLKNGANQYFLHLPFKTSQKKM